MPKFLEQKLKAEYGQNSKVPYKVMNAIGAMHGNKETAKGREMEKKHMEKPKYAHTNIEHHSDGSHTVKHLGHMKPASKSGAIMSQEESDGYGASNHGELFSKLKAHLGMGAAAAPKSDAAELKPAEHEPQTAEYEEDQAGE